MTSILRALLARRLVRFLPGGWLALILLSPRTRSFARSLWASRQQRRRRSRARALLGR
jgi:hypothetical protein